MNTQATYIKPDKYEIEVTIRATFEEWAELKRQLMDKWPSANLSRQISDVLAKLTRQVMADGAP